MCTTVQQQVILVKTFSLAGWVHRLYNKMLNMLTAVCCSTPVAMLPGIDIVGLLAVVEYCAAHD